MKAQRLSRLDQRRGCTPVWQSSTCRPAKSSFLPAHRLSKSSSTNRDMNRLQKQKQQVVAAMPVGQDNRLMFWAFLGDMSGFPRLGGGRGGVGGMLMPARRRPWDGNIVPYLDATVYPTLSLLLSLYG